MQAMQITYSTLPYMTEGLLLHYYWSYDVRENGRKYLTKNNDQIYQLKNQPQAHTIQNSAFDAEFLSHEMADISPVFQYRCSATDTGYALDVNLMDDSLTFFDYAANH